MSCSCGQENPSSATNCQWCGKPLAIGSGLRRLLIDTGAAAGLLAALVLVFLVSKRTASFGRSGPLENRGNVSLKVVSEDENSQPASPLRIAVTPPEYDDVGKLLDTLGSGYRFTEISLEDLLDARRLARYDVVFVTCGFAPREWANRQLRRIKRGRGRISSARPEIADRLKDSLRGYVNRGGTLYVSDWHFDLLEIAFPEFVDYRKVGSGAVGTVRARVVDRGLSRRLGPTIELRFDGTDWRPAAFRGRQVTTYLSGTYRTVDGAKATGPLMVQFPHGEGNVIFTSFHNEKQNSQTELQLLRYLVFTTVTAQTDAKVKRTMVRGGFSPVERNLLSASAKQQSATQTFNCPGKRHLQFVLGFENRGAELRMSVIGPVCPRQIDGGKLVKTGNSTFTIDVPKATAGEWKYTITPLKVPYENFPFTLTVGEKE